MFKKKKKPTNDIHIEWLDGSTEVIRDVDCYATVCGNVIIHLMKPIGKDLSYIISNGAFKKVTRWEHKSE